jgi:hypothetical protein
LPHGQPDHSKRWANITACGGGSGLAEPPDVLHLYAFSPGASRQSIKD